MGPRRINVKWSVGQRIFQPQYENHETVKRNGNGVDGNATSTPDEWRHIRPEEGGGDGFAESKRLLAG